MFYSDIVNILTECGNKIAKKCEERHTTHNIPGWTENVEPLHEAARNSYMFWRNSGKPRNGPVHNVMKKCKYMFKYALCKYKLNKNTFLQASKYK